jgi:hypothetical protein
MRMVNICGAKVKFHILSLVITITDTFGVREMRCVHIIVLVHRLMCNSVHHLKFLTRCIVSKIYLTVFVFWPLHLFSVPFFFFFLFHDFKPICIHSQTKEDYTYY